MYRLSRAVLPLVLVLIAGCGADLHRANAQDLGAAFVAPAPPVKEAAAVTETGAKPAVALSRGPAGALPQRVTRGVSAADPLRVMIIGDSLADGFGIFMKQVVARRDLPIAVTNRGRTSTGLARRDFYDWPGQFASLAAGDRPDIVVAHFGANDDQAIKFPGGRAVAFGTADWDKVYKDQMREILASAARAGAVVYVLGPAPDAKQSRNAHLIRINPMFRDVARETGAHFISLPAFTAGPNGSFVASVNGTKIRTKDGSHFTGAGYTLVVDQILAAIERDNPRLFSPAPAAASVEIASLQ